MERGRAWIPLFVLLAGAALLWPIRQDLTPEAIARRSPEEAAVAAVFLLVLYGLKSLSVCVPLSALTAAGGLLFPLPAALAVNLAGAAVAQTLPWLLGRRDQAGLEALGQRHPKAAGLCRLEAGRQWMPVFLLRLAGASPGDLVSFYLGAAGVPFWTYLSAGLLGAAPRVAAATLLGAALWAPGSPQFWGSLSAGTGMTVLAGGVFFLWRARRV